MAIVKSEGKQETEYRLPGYITQQCGFTFCKIRITVVGQNSTFTVHTLKTHSTGMQITEGRCVPMAREGVAGKRQRRTKGRA